MVRTYFAESEPSQKTIVEKRLLQFSLFLPFFMPVIAGLIFNLPTGSRTFLSSLFGEVLGLPLAISISAIIFGGIPYIVLLAGALIWSRDKSDVQVHRMIWLLPIIFVPLFWAFWIVVSVLWSLDGDALSTPTGMESGSVLVLSLVLIVGYAYVLPVSLTYLLVKTARAG